MSSSGGSTAFFILSLLTISLLVLLLLRYYLPLRQTPSYVLVPVFLALFLPASIILLVPIDLASSAGTDTTTSRGIWLSEKVVFKSWRVTYWLTFALTWFILPLLGEYCDSGYREPKDRFVYSLRSNGRYQAIMLGTGSVGAIYFFAQNGWHWESFKALIMALAYAWGLILAIYLMGHGLVAVPRGLWHFASVSNRLKRLQGQAPKVHDRLTEAMDKLEAYESQVAQLKSRKNGTTKEYQEWIEELAETCSLPEARAPDSARSRSVVVPAVITERYLADLSRKLKRARHARVRFSDEWDRLVRKAIDTQAILDSAASKRLEFRTSPFSTPRSGFLSRFTVLTPYTRYLLHKHLLPFLYYTLSTLASLASASIIWSETVKSLDPKLSLVGLTVVHHPRSDRGQIGFGGQCIAALWLCYMCLCALYSLSEVKIWGNRALVRRNTYLESATWYGLQVAKLTVPLAYNFVTFVPPSLFKGTGFHKFLGKLIVLTPLGSWFEAVFPMLVLLPVGASLFGLYSRIRGCCGLGDLLEDEEDAGGSGGGGGGGGGVGNWREGRALIEREVGGLGLGSAGAGGVVGLASRRSGGGANGSSSAGLLSSSSSSSGLEGGRGRDGARYTDDDDDPAAPTTASASSTLGVLGGGVGSSSRNGFSHAQRPPRRSARVVRDLDEEGEGFFSEFADRVRNTFDTMEFTRPKWMSGGNSGSGSEEYSGVGRSARVNRGDDDDDDDGGDGGNLFLRLFGGRDEGRVRL